MSLLEYVERFVSWLFFNNKGNDDLMFTKTPAFKNLPEPTINVISPDGGEHNTYLKLEHTQDGEDRHPILEWELPEGLTADAASEDKQRVFEYLVVCEDVDLPVPRYFAEKIFHSIIYSIPGTKRSFGHVDVTAQSSSSQEQRTSSGYRFIKNHRGSSYMGARPLIGHGEHRYLYQVIALGEPLNLALLGETPSKAKMADAVVGKVVGWGCWTGRYNRTPELQSMKQSV